MQHSQKLAMQGFLAVSTEVCTFSKAINQTYQARSPTYAWTTQLLFYTLATCSQYLWLL